MTVAKLQIWFIVSWVEYCTSPSLIQRIAPLQDFDRRHRLDVDWWLVGRSNGHVAWILIGLDDWFHGTLYPIVGSAKCLVGGFFAWDCDIRRTATKFIFLSKYAYLFISFSSMLSNALVWLQNYCRYFISWSKLLESNSSFNKAIEYSEIIVPNMHY